jgi:hypothetical protein
MFKELEDFVDLSHIDIDFNKFRSQVVKHHFECFNLTGNNRIWLRTHDTSLPIEKQINPNKTTVTSLSIDQLDDFSTVDWNILIENFRLVKPENFTHYTTLLTEKFPYIIEVLDKVEKFSNIKFRIINSSLMKPSSSLDFHIDYGTDRLHIPIVTQIPECFFYVKDSFVTMPSYTKLYKLHTNTVHNAFNTGKKDRLHLIFNNAEQEVIYDTREKIIELHSKLKDMANDRLKNIDRVDLLLNPAYYSKLLKNQHKMQ